jgi:glutamate racemase
VSASRPVGVLDSGVGGLSLLRDIRRELPHEDLLYVADSAYAPYGDRSTAWIARRSARIIEFLVEQDCKAVVIACNTITAVAVGALRKAFDIPIIAIEPAIKPAVALTRSGVIAVMATSRTLQSDSLHQLRRRHAAGVEVLFVPCPGLADRVEAIDLDSVELHAQLHALLSPALRKGADTLVLGCTHYPFLLDSIARVAGAGVRIVDPSPAVAAEVRRRLHEQGLLRRRVELGIDSVWTSAATDQARDTIGALLDQHLGVRQLPPLGRD